MELFAFSNFVAITNTNGGINNGVAPFNTFLTSWGAGYSWDTKASFSWGLGDVIDQYTNQTTHLEFNPSIDVYAYLHGYFTMTSAYAMLSFSANVSPFDITPIEFDVLVPTTSLGVCFGISSQSSPVHIELNMAFGWPACGWSVFDYFLGGPRGT